MTKEKMVTIVMPVGVDAGRQISVTEDEASRLKSVFGEYSDTRPGPSPADGSARVAELEAEMVTLKKRKATPKEAAERIEELELQVVELECLLETATVSDNDATSQTGDNS